MNILSPLWGLIKRVFIPPVVVGALILGGILALVGAHLGLDPSPEQNLFSGIGTAILASGVFSAVVKSLQFSELFRKELRAVLADWEETEDREERIDRWRRRASGLFKGWFPAPDKVADILLHFVYDNERTYYADCSFDYFVESFDLSTGMIRVKETTRLVIHAHDKGTTVLLNPSWHEETHDGQRMDLEMLMVNDVPKKPEIDREVRDGRRIVSYRLELHGEKRYVIHRESRRTFSVFVEPWIRMTMARHATDARVRVHGTLAELSVNLLSIGTPKDFASLQVDEGRMWSYTNTLFPDQGYMLVLTPQQRPSPAPTQPKQAP